MWYNKPGQSAHFLFNGSILRRIDMNVQVETTKAPKRSMPGLHEAFPSWMFSHECQRPTLVIIPFFRGEVLLVNPIKAPKNWWVPPQEGVRRDDWSLAITLRRGLHEEFHLYEKDYIKTGIIITGPIDNPIPQDRVAGDTPFFKVLIIVTVRLHTRDVTLNRGENNSYRWVASNQVGKAMEVIAERRPVKYKAVLTAMGNAYKAYAHAPFVEDLH